MLKILVALALIATIVQESLQRATEIPCDLDSRNVSCPDSYCCVRDDFLFTETYCKPHGGVGKSCVTHKSDFECPCMDGLYCTANIHGSHAQSVFGTCTTTPGTTFASYVTGTDSPGVTQDYTEASTGDSNPITVMVG